MSVDPASLPYLRGEEFSNAFLFPVREGRLVSRNMLLQELAAGKTVLHYGCADHVELIEAKRAEGTYLHDLLTGSARRVIGADINRGALEAMRNIGIEDLYHPNDLPGGLSYDLVLAPDVIEHVPDVALFLDALAVFHRDVVVTTPNAFRLSNRSRFRTEHVNSDHKYWFSPYTLAKTLVDSGYQIKSMWLTDFRSRRNPIRTWVTNRYPLCRDGLAVLAAPPS